MESHVITDGGRANFYFAETLCSITAFCRLYAGKTPHFNIPQERKALRNNFIGSVFFTFSPVRLS